MHSSHGGCQNKEGTTGGYSSNNVSRSPIDVTVPYYNKYKCYPNGGYRQGANATQMALANLPALDYSLGL